MSDIAVPGGRLGWRDKASHSPVTASPATDATRVLQLMLAATWLLCGVLQYQPFMFTRAFGQLLAQSAQGNPAFLARPITWDATLVEQHAVLLNAIFATTQLLLGLGIAFRPTVRLALAASVAWAVAVWWLGEGLGGVLTATASPVNGAPGPVILYALLAVLLWPTSHRISQSPVPAPFPAAGAVGARVARALWLILWLSLAWFALQPASRAPQALHDMIAGAAAGEPNWLAAVERHAAALVAGRGLAVSIVLTVALVLIAVGVYLPRPAVRASIAVAIIVAVLIWVVGEACGMILATGSTDPDSGPLLVLLALAYWPRTPARPQNRGAAS